MLKIVYYLPSLYTPGGLERIITLKANYLAEHYDYSVTILTSEQKGRKPYYTLSEKVRHVDLDVVFDEPGVKSFLTKAARYPLKYYRFKKRFADFLCADRPDITISTLRRELNFIHSIPDGSIKIGEFHVTRNSYHAMAIANDDFVVNILKSFWTKLFLRNIKRLSKFVVLTHEEAANWPELDNVAVVHNPLTFFPERVSECSSKQVIAVGRYAYQKGFDLLIESWRMVVEKHPGWTLRIFGGGDRTQYEEQVKRLKIGSTCILEEAEPNIIEKYLDSSVFVLSSRFEGFGMVITEAMSCGLPVVSFACPCGPKDIIQDGVDGLLVTPEDIVELAEKICLLIENEKMRLDLGQAARLNSRRFSMETIAGQWNDLFVELLDREN